MSRMVYVIRIVMVMVLVNLAATPALAQTPASLPDDEGGTMTWVIAVGIIIVTGLSSFINPKRTHLT